MTAIIPPAPDQEVFSVGSGDHSVRQVGFSIQLNGLRSVLALKPPSGE
jgi:hypothetical protein